MQELREENICEIKNILASFSEKKIIIVGPCSADDEKAVLEYVAKLLKLSQKVNKKLFIMSRIYTAKPRSRNSYKGILHEDDDFSFGLERQRNLHIKAFSESGIPTCDELLYVDNFNYLDDVVSYMAVGARTVESPSHRFVASGLDVPVGMKNPINGSIDSLVNSLCVAQIPQKFVQFGFQLKTTGNKFAHSILRGGTLKSGENFSNHSKKDILELLEKYSNEKLENPALVVDASHSNSNKNPKNQRHVIKSVTQSMSQDKSIHNFVKGFMIESYLNEGQSANEYGVSKTDSCLGFENTERLILDIAEEL
ncbi:MAG: 3-deoxy-7-phosphoheptulonate synthase [Firmicutes bacterium]|nr:3-deoxy-7-phosphoheptulonate synthase [Bacillota bacterium]